MLGILRKTAANCALKLRNFDGSMSHSIRHMTDTAYDYDGKTRINVLNNDFEEGMMINAFSEVRNTVCYDNIHIKRIEMELCVLLVFSLVSG